MHTNIINQASIQMCVMRHIWTPHIRSPEIPRRFRYYRVKINTFLYYYVVKLKKGLKHTYTSEILCWSKVNLWVRYFKFIFFYSKGITTSKDYKYYISV